MEIDGGDTGLSHEFLVLPGDHTVSVLIFRFGSVPSAHTGHPPKKTRLPMCTCEVRVHTEAGAEYFVDSRELSDGVWIAWVGPDLSAGDPRPDPQNLPHCTCPA